MNEQAAKATIGSLLQRPGPLASLRALGVTASDFPPYVADAKSTMPGTYRLVFGALCELQDQGLLGDDDCTLMVRHHLNGKAGLVDWQKITDHGIVASSDLSGYARLLLKDSNQHYVAARLSRLSAAVADGDAEGLSDQLRGLAELSERASNGRRRNIFHADDRKAHIKPARAVVEDVAHRGQVTAIGGAAGSGKTHIAVDIAATAAQFCQVYYITNEAPDEIDAQLDAFEAFHDCGLPGLTILDDVAGLFHPSRTDSIITSARGSDLIILDILSNEFEGREETNENMAVAFASAKRIARELDCAFIMLAHTGWLGDHIRGGSQSYGSARRVFLVENSDEVISLKVVKANVKRGTDAHRFRIIQIPWERIKDGDETRAAEYTVIVPADRVVDDGPLSAKQTELLRCLALPVFLTVGASPAEIRDHTGQSKSTCNNATSVLLKRNLVDRAKHKLVINCAGLSYLQALDDEPATDQSKAENTTEPATNAGVYNWSIAFNSVRNESPLVREGSDPVRSWFVPDGSEVRSYPLPYRGYDDRTAEPDETEERLW